LSVFYPQIDYFEVTLTRNEEVWLQCKKCDWDDMWSGSTTLATLVDEAICHYDRTHR